MRRTIIVLGGALMVAGCSPHDGTQQPSIGANDMAAGKSFKPGPDPFGWPVMSAQGKRVGTVATRLEKQDVLVTLDTAGLQPGVHGVHIHQDPKCEAPSFASAGGHWNWTSKKHGHQNPQGYHAGDLGNLTVGADGRGQATFRVAAKDWDPKMSGGLPIVIHATADDQKTDPSGNSGDRIACGILYLRRD
jgi:Cu-Zn family superoxide dismutase